MMKNKKVVGSTIVKLYKNKKHIKKDQFMNIVGYLFNRNLINLPDEYWIEEDNGWKSTYYRNYPKIYNDFEKLTNGDFKVEKVKDDG